jgi:hypothetical protein
MINLLLGVAVCLTGLCVGAIVNEHGNRTNIQILLTGFGFLVLLFTIGTMILDTLKALKIH